MPVKRRASKARRELDSQHIECLMYGPDVGLLNGCGYDDDALGGSVYNMDDAGREIVIERMREDWERHSALIWEAWNARDAHALYCAKTFYRNPKQPWAATEFGDDA